MSRSAHAHPHKVVSCRDYDILVPFICHRCGNCCRNYDPIVELGLLPEIAKTLGEPIDAIQDRLRVKGLSHRAGRPTDCCFLHPRHSACMIYEVRPTDCRQFPPLAGVGAGAVDCAGHREYLSVLKLFAGRSNHISQSRSTAARQRRRIHQISYRDVLRALIAANVSKEYRKVFEALNG